jgi:hypothetical protein
MTDWQYRIDPKEPPESIGNIISGALNAVVTQETIANNIRGLYNYSSKRTDYFANLDIGVTVGLFTQKRPDGNPILYESMLRQEKSMAQRNLLPPISEEGIFYKNILDLGIFVAKRMALRYDSHIKFAQDVVQIATQESEAADIFPAPLSDMIGELKLMSGNFGNIAKNLILLRNALAKLSENGAEPAHEERLANLKILAVAPEIIKEACDAFDAVYVSGAELNTEIQIRAKDRTEAHIAALNEFAQLLSPAIQKAKGELKGRL